MFDDKEDSGEYLKPEEIQHIIPENEEEFQAMIKELKGFGFEA